LHALCSATIGFFLARSFCQVKYRKLLFLTGLTLSIVLHGLFNLSIINIVGYLDALVGGQTTPAYFQVFIASVFAIIVILVGLIIFVTFGFRNLKKLSSTCKITS
jgi:RsiW-degrading membrane proteinase PrsW (M82 family)